MSICSHQLNEQNVFKMTTLNAGEAVVKWVHSSNKHLLSTPSGAGSVLGARLLVGTCHLTTAVKTL